MIDWSDFDKEYPVEDVIVNTLPEELQYKVAVNTTAKTFFDVHPSVMEDHQNQKLLENKKEMASLQMEFYDKFAKGFQNMDDNRKKRENAFQWKIERLAIYDEQFFKKPKLLFIGAGNCRFAIRFAKKGYKVTATDISRNMLLEGKKIADEMGLDITFVAQNAENPFPFKSEKFDTVYSLCVANHIVDWKNYFNEKIRCLKPNGVLLERMPNAKLWSFWKKQGELNKGVEIKAEKCHRDSAYSILNELNLTGDVWTHDRITRTDALARFYPFTIPRKLRMPFSKKIYKRRSYNEDEKLKPHEELVPDDDKGIYTMIRIEK